MRTFSLRWNCRCGFSFIPCKDPPEPVRRCVACGRTLPARHYLRSLSASEFQLWADPNDLFDCLEFAADLRRLTLLLRHLRKDDPASVFSLLRVALRPISRVAPFTKDELDANILAWGRRDAAAASLWARMEIRKRLAREPCWERQCEVIRDLFGHYLEEWQPALTWERWNSSRVLAVAEGIDENSTYEDVPILGDALEEAGCTEPLILNHCRQPGNHHSGCWVVDGLLGRE